MDHRVRPAILQEDAELPQILDGTIHVDRRKVPASAKSTWGHRDGVASDADGFKSNGLFAEQMCDAFERRPLADTPFAEMLPKIIVSRHRASPKFCRDAFDIFVQLI
jgi:hypothetical protein